MTAFSTKTPLGTPATDFSLPDVSGKMYTLADFKDKEILVVIFTCNHCPYAKASWPILVDLEKKFRDRVTFVAINPNDETAYPEDSFEKMKEYAQNWDIEFPYLRDEWQGVAKAYDAQCTPDVYVFDKGRKLVYRGRINDNWKEPTKVTREDLKEALEALLKGEPVSPEQIPSMGCSIKWKT